MGTPTAPPTLPPTAPLFQVFTPASPIRSRTRLFGRAQRLRQGEAVLRTPGRHLLVLGEPGVGRTSYSLCLAEGRAVRYHAVGLDDRFDTLLERLLDAPARHTSEPPGVAHAGGPPAEEHSAAPSPWSATQLPTGTVLILDDVDRLARPSLEEGIVPLLRALSDAASDLTAILVARRDRPLPGALSDLGLRLHALVLDRLGAAALRALVDAGAQALDLRVEPALRDRIVLDSDGLPGFVHALCLESVQAALEADRTHVRLGTDYLPALQAVVDSLGPGLAEAYAAATAGRGRRNRYAHLLWAAAACPEGRFRLADLMDGLARIEGRPVRQQGFATHLGDLLQRGIFARLPDGTYRFSDPAMRAYVRLLLRRDHPRLLGEDPLQLGLPY